jgi:protein tyrosine/serine phosphatase
MKSFLSSWTICKKTGVLMICLTFSQLLPAVLLSSAAADEQSITAADKSSPAANEATPASEHSASDPAVKEVANAHKEKPLLQRGDLPNFHEVYPYLYRGGEPTEAGMSQLKTKGVGTIIDLRAKTEQEIAEAKIAKQLGFKYINLPMTSEAPTPAQINKVLSSIEDAKKKHMNGDTHSAVFVHCAHGSDRTGCMIGIWRVSRDGWDYPTAYKEMRKYYFTPKFVKLAGAVQKEAARN